MDRRELLGYIGAGAAGMLASNPTASGAEDKKEHDDGHVKTLTRCARVCNETAHHCLEAIKKGDSSHHDHHDHHEHGDHHDRGDHHDHDDHHDHGDHHEHHAHHARVHEMAMDCQAFCGLSAALAARHSPLAHHSYKACAEACRCCAEACEKSKDEKVRHCAKVCRECEKMCRKMSGRAA